MPPGTIKIAYHLQNIIAFQMVRCSGSSGLSKYCVSGWLLRILVRPLACNCSNKFKGSSVSPRPPLFLLIIFVAGSETTELVILRTSLLGVIAGRWRWRRYLATTVYDSLAENFANIFIPSRAVHDINVIKCNLGATCLLDCVVTCFESKPDNQQ